jgi:hypothetical protein
MAQIALMEIDVARRGAGGFQHADRIAPLVAPRLPRRKAVQREKPAALVLEIIARRTA